MSEAFSGISEEMGDVGLAVQRAEDKTAQMQARAGAIDELIASGALDDQISIGGGDDIDRELAALSSSDFTTLGHPAFPNYDVRIKKSDFCDGTVA